MTDTSKDAVERYDKGILAMVPMDDGPWVLAEDYDALAQRCADLEARAERAEAERDAIAAAMVEAAADILDTHGDSAATEALGQQLCCNGQMCGCRGASVGEYLQHLIRALTPADALAKLDQIRARNGLRGGVSGCLG